jgi:2,3-bisphosphoglycerate-independent phosphoglycerate mutase
MTAFFIVSTLSPSLSAYAQTLPFNTLQLPPAGTMVPVSDPFTPALIRGVTVHPDNPLQFNFIVDTGDAALTETSLREEATRLIKYFLATITIPEDDLWVNLSPTEKDRVIPEQFGVTEMGRDLLAQDYLLKQLTASLMYPEKQLGRSFWQKVRSRAKAQFGTEDIPMDAVHKVWIVPKKAVIYQHENSAYVIDSQLKVMMEREYLQTKHASSDTLPDGRQSSRLTSDVVKEIILPAIEKEVNNGEHFARLRQVYHSMILAAWYKDALRQSLLNRVYADKRLTKGVDVKDKAVKDKIYAQYMQAFKKGVYDYIREDFNPATGEIIPRQYTSGGAAMRIDPVKTVIKGAPSALNETDRAMITRGLEPNSIKSRLIDFDVTVVENLADIPTQEIQAALAAPETQRYPSPAPAHKRVADMLIHRMAHDSETVLTLAVDEAESRGLSSTHIQQINDDITIPLWITNGHLNQDRTIHKIPNLLKKIKHQAETELTEIMPLVRQLKGYVASMKSARSDTEYMTFYAKANYTAQEVAYRLKDIQFHVPSDLPYKTAADKINKARQILKNTIKHDFSQALIIDNINPEWLPFDAADAKKAQRFALVEKGIEKIERKANLLTNLTVIPKQEPGSHFFDTEDAYLLQPVLTNMEKEKAGLVADQILKEMRNAQETILKLNRKTPGRLIITEKTAALINQDITRPLVVEILDEESFLAQRIPNMAQILSAKADQEMQAFMKPLQDLQVQIHAMKTAATAEEYARAYSGIPPLIMYISYLMDIMTYQYPGSGHQTPAERKMRQAEQTLKNTIRFYIAEHMLAYFLSPDSQPFNKPWKDKDKTFFQVEKNLLQIHMFADVLSRLKRVPKRAPKSTLFNLKDLVDAAHEEDTAMAAAPHKRTAKKILAFMPSDQKVTRAFDEEEMRLIEFKPEMIPAINKDVSFPVFVRMANDGQLIAETMPRLTTLARQYAQKQWDQFQGPLATIEQIIGEMRHTSDVLTYRALYHQLHEMMDEARDLLFTLKTSAKDNRTIKTPKDKRAKVKRVINNTLMEYLNTRLIHINLLPEAVFMYRSQPVKGTLIRNMTFNNTEERLNTVNAVFEHLTTLDTLPDFRLTKPAFDLTPVVTPNNGTLPRETRVIGRTMEQTLNLLNRAEIMVDPDEFGFLRLHKVDIQAINQDLSQPLWISQNEQGHFVIKHLHSIRSLIQETTEAEAFPFLRDLSRIKHSVQQMAAASDAESYAAAYADIEESLKTLSTALTGLDPALPENQAVMVDSSATKLERAGQVTKNTLKHFISNKVNVAARLDPFLTPFDASLEKKHHAFQSVRRGLREIDALFNILMNTGHVPPVLNGVFHIDQLITDNAREDFAMAAHRRVARKIIKNEEFHGEYHALTPAFLAQIGLTDEMIPKINQDLYLPIWLSGSVKTGVMAHQALMLPQNFKPMARHTLEPIFPKIFSIVDHMESMLRTKSPKANEQAFDKLNTLVAETNQHLAQIATPVDQIPVPESLNEKINRLFTFFKNSIHYFAGHPIKTDMIAPENLPVTAKRPVREEAFKQFNHQLITKGGILHRFFTINRMPEPIDALGILDLTQHLGWENRHPEDFAMLSQKLRGSYVEGVTDEFIPPTVVHTPDGQPKGRIRPNDSLVFFNYRADRAREILRAFKQPGFTQFPVTDLNLNVVTMADYEIYDTVPLQDVAFPALPLEMTLGEAVSKAGLTQFRTAETEKYNHVTYFFNGRQDKPFEGETRKLVPSPQDVATYDEKPAMSADAVTDGLVERITTEADDLIIVNYANPDMVGHTGNFKAAQKAIEAVDKNLQRAVTTAQAAGYNILITADHGNAEQMWDAQHQEKLTAHTTNPVPFIFIPSKSVPKKGDLIIRGNGKLADVAPTALHTLKVAQPGQMTGQSLISGFDYAAAPPQKTLLIILDGWGVNPDRQDPHDAIRTADTPTMDRLLATTMNTTLDASGAAVGLPEGLMGNSDVGHSNLGGGRVDDQLIVAIDKAIKDGRFFENPRLSRLMEQTREAGRALHLMGLVSDGQVHSSMEHLFALVEMARRHGLDKVYIHAILDGRDTSPQSGIEWLSQLQDKIAQTGTAEIVDVIGRFYAMDRDKRWERVKVAYDMYTEGKTEIPSATDAAMVSDELKAEILQKDIFAIPFNGLLNLPNPYLQSIKGDIQRARKDWDLARLYKNLIRIQAFLTRNAYLMKEYTSFYFSIFHKTIQIDLIASQHDITLPDGARVMTETKSALSRPGTPSLDRELTARAEEAGLFTFDYPTVSGAEKQRVKDLKEKVRNAADERDLVQMYKLMVVLRKNTDTRTHRGRPYYFLTKRIKAFEQFASKQKIALPDKDTLSKEDFAMPVAFEEAGRLLGVRPYLVAIGLLLGHQNVPAEVYSYYATSLREAPVLPVDMKAVDPMIFARFIAGESSIVFDETAVMRALEEAGLMPALTARYRQQQAARPAQNMELLISEATGVFDALMRKAGPEDQAMGVEDDVQILADLINVAEETIALALGNAFEQIEYKVYFNEGLQSDVPLEDIDLEEADPGIFIETLINEGDLEMGQGELIELLEAESLFMQMVREYRQRQNDIMTRIRAVMGEDTAMTTTPAMITYLIEHSLEKIQELHATQERVARSETEDGLIQLNVGQMLTKTPEGWAKFFKVRMMEEQDRLRGLIRKLDRVEKEQPTDADTDIPALTQMFMTNGRAAPMEEAFDDTQARYQFIRDNDSIYDALRALKKDLPRVKINLLVKGAREKITFFDALRYPQPFAALHIVTYKDDSINAVLVRGKPQDGAMATPPRKDTYIIVSAMRNLLTQKAFTLDTEETYRVIPRVDYQIMERRGTMYPVHIMDLDIKGGPMTQPARAGQIRVQKVGGRLSLNMELDLTALRLRDNAPPVNLSRTDLSGQIMNRLKDALTPAQMALLILSLRQRIGERVDGALFNSLYDPVTATTSHFFEGHGQMINIVLVPGDERNLPPAEILNKRGKALFMNQDFAMEVDPMILNQRIQQSFRVLTEMNQQAFYMARQSRPNDVFDRAGESPRIRTAWEWARFYHQKYLTERTRYEALVRQREIQERQNPAEADKDITDILQKMRAGEFRYTDDNELDGMISTYEIIEDRDRVYAWLQILHQRLAQKKINLFARNYGRVEFKTLFENYFQDQDIRLHIVSYADGSVNAVYSHGPQPRAKDAVLKRQQTVDQQFLNDGRPGRQLLQDLADAQITAERIESVLAEPLFIGREDSVTFLPRDWRGLLSRYAKNLSEDMRQDFGMGWLEVYRKWMTAQDRPSTDQEAVLLVFDAMTPVLRRATEVIIPKENLMKLMAALVANGRRKEALRFLEFLERKAGVSRAPVRSEAKTITRDDDYGGIDFTRSRLDLEIRRDGNGVPLPLMEQPLNDMRIEGFAPVIINVTPLPQLPALSLIREAGPFLVRSKK